MNGKRVIANQELEGRLDDYLRLVTAVQAPTSIQELTAMSLHHRGSMRKHWWTIGIVIVLGALATVVALASRDTSLLAPANPTPTPVVQATATAQPTDSAKPTVAPTATPVPSAPPALGPTTAMSVPAGAFSFRYPSAWAVSGPCNSPAQMLGEPSSEEVLVGPGASGCGRSAGQTGVDVQSTTGSGPGLLTPAQYQGCTLTTKQVVVDGVAGTRQEVTNCQGTDFVEYQFTTNGRNYLVALNVPVNPGITVAQLDSIVTTTFHFHA